jgi:hypothetical protein
MASYVEVVAVSQGLLPSPCPHCLWWQSSAGPVSGIERRLAWMTGLERTWGSVGMVSSDGAETVAAIQFAPVRALPRVFRLPPAPPPDDAVLLYCLRARLGRPVATAQGLLHRTLAHLRDRGVTEAFAYACPLGSDAVCGARNLTGLEFLLSSGFQVVGCDNQVFLTRVDLRGLLPSLSQAGQFWRRLRHSPAAPSPVAFRRSG